jgi:hypothetical protein
MSKDSQVKTQLVPNKKKKKIPINSSAANFTQRET